MLIKSRMGVSVDGFVANTAGVPALALAEGFVPGESGIPLSPGGAPGLPLRLLRADRFFPDGPAELVCTPGK
jgi:hypothetical protein